MVAPRVMPALLIHVDVAEARERLLHCGGVGNVDDGGSGNPVVEPGASSSTLADGKPLVAPPAAEKQRATGRSSASRLPMVLPANEAVIVCRSASPIQARLASADGQL